MVAQVTPAVVGETHTVSPPPEPITNLRTEPAWLVNQNQPPTPKTNKPQANMPLERAIRVQLLESRGEEIAAARHERRERMRAFWRYPRWQWE